MVVSELRQGISRYVEAYVSGDAEALARCLEFLTQQANISTLLNGIMEDEEVLRGVTERSVWHPNGFAKIVLDSQRYYRLRLHFWRSPSGFEAEAQENIHNHRWDFSTVILSGRYRHQEFRPGAPGREFHGYHYHKHPADSDEYRLVPTGKHLLRCVFDASFTAGTQYSMSSEVLHRVIPDSRSPAVSLVLEGPHQEQSVHVFSPAELTSVPENTHFRHITREFVTRCLRDTLLSSGIGH